MASQTGWLCYNCFATFVIDDRPNWTEKRLEILDSLYKDYAKLLTSRKVSEHKRINEMLDSIKEEQCSIHTAYSTKDYCKEQ